MPVKSRVKSDRTAGSPDRPPRPSGPEQAAASKARILKGLAHPLRIAIFEALAPGELTVGELARSLGAKESNTSRHLALMKAAGLLEARKDGLQVYYAVKLPCLLSMLACLNDGVCTIADEHGRVADFVRGSGNHGGKEKRQDAKAPRRQEKK